MVNISILKRINTLNAFLLSANYFRKKNELISEKNNRVKIR